MIPPPKQMRLFARHIGRDLSWALKPRAEGVLVTITLQDPRPKPLW